MVRIWDWRRQVLVREIETGLGEIAFDRADARIVTFDGEVVETFDIRTGARIGEEFVGRPASYWDTAISPDGSRVATSYANNSIALFDTDTGEQVVLRLQIASATTLSFSSDGRQLASVGTGFI